MKLIVGLGNPGEKYAGVRHNLGFMVVEELSAKCKVQSAKWEYKEKFKSEILRLDLSLSTNHLSLILAKPQTYMNNSGMAIKLLTTYYKLPTTDLIVVHDDLDLPLGKIKIRMGGAAAGHHGVESIIAALGTDQFIRVRLGIGPATGVVEKFVLEPFVQSEKHQVKHIMKQAIKALNLLLEKGLEKAQNQYN
ncbi:aminoacyl-tRNA hydrolase [Candidatus Daviesbacteria bacterium]|nr:aminoacyl-tRNA hydrolase [Candidatus Daviesbacteria bacterium]